VEAIEAQALGTPRSDPASLDAAVEAIVELLGKAKTACALPGILVARAELRGALQSVIDNSGLPFATMIMDKSVLDEQSKAYAGIYDGNLMDEPVREFVESCDQVLAVGTLMTGL
jgi:indolepyruvate decarboxylase